MIKINLVCVGNLKERFYVDAFNEYLKRLKKFCDIRTTEIEESLLSKSGSFDIEKILETEGVKILKSLKGTVIVLDILGKKIDSIGFSTLLNENIKSGNEITFVMGGSHGISKSVKDKAHLKLSFSDMTFPHMLMRIILAEQIYRGFCIINNSPYHK